MKGERAVRRKTEAGGGLVLRAGAFAAAVLCMLCMVRILHADAMNALDAWDAIDVQTTAASEDAETPDAPATGESPPPETTETGQTAVSVQTAATGQSASTAQTEQPSEPVSTTLPAAPARDTEALAAAFAEIPVANDAGVSFDPAKLASMVPAFTVGTEPLVLIMHTHGSESYTGSADDGETGRSQDIAKNVVRVGQVLCETLEEAGIPALHDETMYDVPSYTASYNRAFDGITAALEAHPSIRIVIDVHRDAYSYPDGSILATSGQYGGERTARLMFLVGTDAGTLAHPEWRSHLAFAMALQTRLEALAPGIARPVNLRRQRFNEHLTPGSLLLEVGASGDTLEEAERAVRVFGRALAQELGAEIA